MLKRLLPLALLLLGSDALDPRDLLRAYAESPTEERLKILLDGGLSLERWKEEIRAFRPSGPAGECSAARVLIPHDYDPGKPWPLLVVSPGTHCGADLSLAWWRAAPEAGYLLACTESLARDNPWDFSHGERAILLTAVREMKLRYNVDEDRVFLAGISKGGHASWDVGFRFPHLFAGIVPDCCRIYNHGLIATGGFDYLENGLDLPAYQIQGALDDPPLVASIREGCKLLKERGADVTYVEFPDRSHVPSTDEYAKALAWMDAHQRPGLPKKTYCRCHDLRYGRRAWTEIAGFDNAVVEENPKKLMLKGKPGGSKEEVDRDKRKHMLEHSALLEAELAGPNEMRVKTQHVEAFAVYLDEERFDLSKPVKVTVNGRKAFEGRVQPSVETLLRMFGKDLDRRRLFVAEIRIRL